MITLVSAVMACIIFVFTAFVATEQASASTGDSDVTCYLNNYTDPGLRNSDGTYRVGQPVKLEAHLSDPAARVNHIVFSMVFRGAKGSQIESGPSRTLSWTPPEQGEWDVLVSLFDGEQPIYPKGECNVMLTVKDPSNEVVSSMKLTAPATTTATTTPVIADEQPRNNTSVLLKLLAIVLMSITGYLYYKYGYHNNL